MLAFDNFLEAANRIRNLDVSSLITGELLGNVEGLREELLHLARPRDRNLVVFGEFINSQNGDDVLQVFIALQDSLYALCDVVMVLANDSRGKNA